MPQLQVLLLEDRLADVKLIIRTLERAGFDPQWQHVQSKEEFIKALSPDLDVILADYNLPQFDALTALQEVKERGLDVPFIVVTGTLEEVAMECVKQGAADYLLKDRLARLGEAVRSALHEKQLRAEKRETEDALRDSERQLRLAVSAARMGTWELNLEDDRIVYGGHFSQLLGISDSTPFSYADLLSMIHLMDRPVVAATIQQSLDDGESFATECRFIRPDGETRWLFAQGQAYPDAAGNRTRISGIIHDITDRKQAEQRSRLLQEITAALSEALTPEQVGEVIITRGLEALGGSAGLVGLLSKDQQALDLVIGTDTITKKHIALTNGGPLTQAVITGKPVWIESIEEIAQLYQENSSVYQAIQAAGAQSIVSMPLIVNQRVIGGVGISFPEPRRFTSEDRALLMSLAAQCAQAMERARLYASEQAARALAEEANELKTQFLAMVSHELRTPLTSIIGFITTLLSDDVAWSHEEEQSFLQVINEESQKLRELVEQLLDVSRLQAGMLSIHPERQYVQGILDTANVQLLALTANHTLTYEVDDSLPEIVADEQRIAQVLTNLVHNAAKYSPPGTQITISAQEGSSGWIEFSVTDQGSGIPREAYQQVFEAFRQLNGDINPQKGVGLGLAICKALIEAHGGKIWIKESTDRGTTISFTLPIAQGEAAVNQS
jgi:PAS domain S-box-containing protein